MGENIPSNRTDHDDGSATPLATACSCGKEFDTTRGLKIHQSRWCKDKVDEQRKICEDHNKSVNGNQSPDINHSVQVPTANQPELPETEPSNERLNWPAGNAKKEWSSLDNELDEILESRLAECRAYDYEGRLSVLTTVVYDKCKGKSGVLQA